jgi:sporulation protein YlmC with PRC-barrel domain
MSEPADAGDVRPGRELLLALQLLDRQIVGREGGLAGKVDDVEITVPDGGGPPVVTAVLTGRGALADRLGGRLGRAAAAVSRRLVVAGDRPGRVPMDRVSDIGDHVTVAMDAAEVPNHAVEAAVRDGIVGRIPGAKDAG